MSPLWYLAGVAGCYLAGALLVILGLLCVGAWLGRTGGGRHLRPRMIALLHSHQRPGLSEQDAYREAYGHFSRWPLGQTKRSARTAQTVGRPTHTDGGPREPTEH